MSHVGLAAQYPSHLTVHVNIHLFTAGHRCNEDVQMPEVCQFLRDSVGFRSRTDGTVTFDASLTSDLLLRSWYPGTRMRRRRILFGDVQNASLWQAKNMHPLSICLRSEAPSIASKDACATAWPPGAIRAHTLLSRPAYRPTPSGDAPYTLCSNIPKAHNVNLNIPQLNSSTPIRFNCSF